MFRISLPLVIAFHIILLPLPSAADEVGIEVIFSDDEIAIIQGYYRRDDALSKHGRKKKHLPPGIAKNLARGKPIPPGIAKRQLPSELVDALPPAPNGHERVIVDGRILLIEVATQVVRDILTDVVIG